MWGAGREGKRGRKREGGKGREEKGGRKRGEEKGGKALCRDSMIVRKAADVLAMQGSDRLKPHNAAE